MSHLDVGYLSLQTKSFLLWIYKLLWWRCLTRRVRWVNNEWVHINICASRTCILPRHATATTLFAAWLEHRVALGCKVLETCGTKGIVTKRWLFAQLKLLWRVHQAAPLVVHEIVTKAYNYERYVVVARLGDTFQSEAFVYYHFRYLSEWDVLTAKLVDSSYNLVLRVAPVNSIRGEDKQVIFASYRVSAAFRVRDDELLHLVVAKCATYAELTIDAIVEHFAIGSLNSLALICPIGSMFGVHLNPATILVRKGCDWVTNIGDRKSTVKYKAKQAGGSVWATVLAGNRQEFVIELLEHYNQRGKTN